MSATESLGKRLIGLPMAHDLPANSIARVLRAVADGCREPRRNNPEMVAAISSEP
jgi:hypothetical protein